MIGAPVRTLAVRRRAVDLLDVLGHPGLVGGALDERRLDLGALDALFDVVDEQVGDRVRVAGGEVRREVVVGVDAGAGRRSGARSRSATSRA